MRYRRAVVALALLAACAEPAGEERTWRYVNDAGRPVFVNDRERIPARHRASATAMDEAPTSSDTQTIYRFTTKSGRPSFVNGIDAVPPELRADAVPVDLSQVSTNPELGRDLDEALDAEWARLVESDPCREARAGATATWLGTLWRENGHLVVLGGAILLLLLLTPWMVRRFDAPTWSRVLALAIPSLALVGIFAHAIVATNARLRSVRALAEPCDPSALSRAPGGPEAVAARFGIVERLRAAVEAADVDAGIHTDVRGAR